MTILSYSPKKVPNMQQDVTSHTSWITH